MNVQHAARIVTQIGVVIGLLALIGLAGWIETLGI